MGVDRYEVVEARLFVHCALAATRLWKCLNRASTVIQGRGSSTIVLEQRVGRYKAVEAIEYRTVNYSKQLNGRRQVSIAYMLLIYRPR